MMSLWTTHSNAVEFETTPQGAMTLCTSLFYCKHANEEMVKTKTWHLSVVTKNSSLLTNRADTAAATAAATPAAAAAAHIHQHHLISNHLSIP